MYGGSLARMPAMMARQVSQGSEIVLMPKFAPLGFCPGPFPVLKC
jgi:hypothetical protein